MNPGIKSGGKLRVLLLEDQPRDIEIICELLAEAGFDLAMETTATEKGFIALLKQGQFDIILADFKLPGFDGFAALRWAREICPDVPFICVSGTIGEEKAVEVLKRGAVDYILKDRLMRLPFAIERALAEAWESRERRRAEQTLRESEERYQTLARISPVGIFRTDAEGRTTYVNPRWCQIAGLDAAQALGDGWLAAVHPDDRERLRRGWRDASGDRRTSYSDYRFLRADESVSWVMGQAIPEVNGEGRIIGYVGTITEISERKRAEDLIRVTLRDKELLLKEVHHRVKNNLMTMIGLINMGEAKAESRTMQTLLRELEGRVRSMALVHENLYKSESLARIDMREYIESLTGFIRSQFAGGHDVRMQMLAADALADLDTAVPCGMILNELITNAFQHAFPGGCPGPGGGRCEITVSMRQEENGYSLIVADNGVGLPPELDWQRPQTLGWRLVQMLSQQIKGTVEVDRSLGTSFTVRFPSPLRA